MIIEVKFNETSTSASHEISEIIVKAGDYVRIDDQLIIVESDKAAVDVTSHIECDENITFSNNAYISDFIEKEVNNTNPQNLILLFSSVSYIDTSAINLLENLILLLKDKSVILNLAEVKGPVMDILNKTELVEQPQPGKIYFTISEGVSDLT